MKIVGDTHVHTIMSGHAHSTLLENAKAAKECGHSFMFITDHTGEMNMCPDRKAYFLCLNATVPENFDGMHMIRGCEANIVGENGEIDMDEGLLETNEWVIASLHTYVYKPKGYDVTTNIWLRAAENPHIDVIGHCGEEPWKFDYEKGIKKFKEYGKIVEINSNSIKYKPGCKVNCREIALLCKKYEVPVVVSSDAHFAWTVGDVGESLKMLSEINFPKKLILNADYDSLARVLEEKTGRRF